MLVCADAHDSMFVLQDMVVEAAFPECAISSVRDWTVRDNKKVMFELQHMDHSEGYSGRLLSGSRPEGLAMDDDWGHGKTDWDFMHLHGGVLCVNVPGGQQPRGKSCLDFCPEGCPVAYTKLLVTDLPNLRRRKRWIEGSVHRSGNQCWLNTARAVHWMQRGATISGPAAQNNADTHVFVTTLVCNGPHPDMDQEFANRPRQWPPAALISDLLKLPMLLVLVGHKHSPEFNLQARLSWSHLEFKLINELPKSVRQGYIACKYVLKRFLKARRGQTEVGGGRSRVCSYHIKTVFLRYLEKTPPSIITSPFRLFLDLFHELDKYLKVGKLPHYFLSQCDLLETVIDDELCIARQVIQEILSDPLNALLTSPTNPEQICGKIRPDYLVSAFHRVLSHPTCEQSWKDLSKLLARVDERRQQRYREQCERDRKWPKLSGRADLAGLAATVKQIKRH